MAEPHGSSPLYIDIDEEKLETLTQLVEARHFPLYGTILADTADETLASFIKVKRLEIEEISGKDCGFIFFHNLNNAKNFSFVPSEHLQRVSVFTQLLNIEFSKLPCLLFFEQLDSGKYITISLANQSSEQMNGLIHQIFESLYSRKNIGPLTQLKRFKTAQFITRTKKTLLRNIAQISEEIIVDLAAQLIKN